MKKNKLEAAFQNKVESFLGNGYNPLLQKPKSLEPINPMYPAGWGSYIYFGPPPDFGGSYGAYEDAQGRKQVGIKSSKSYSVYDGSPISCHSELTPEEREVLLTQLDEASETHKCQHCRSELILSAGSDLKVENLHCPFCASSLDGAMDKVKKCISKIEEINMKKVTVQAEVDVAKKAMEAPAPVDHNKDEKKVFNDAKKAQTPNEISQENFSQPEEVKLIEPSLKNVVKEGEVKVQEVKAAAVNPARQARVKRALAAIQIEESKRKKEMAAKVAAAKTEKSVIKPVVAAKEGLNLTAEQVAQLNTELRVLASKDPAKFEKVKKNKALAKICASVEAAMAKTKAVVASLTAEEKAQAKAELKILAKTNPEQALALEEQLQFEAPEILVDTEPVVEPAAPVDPEAAPAVEPVVEPVCKCEDGSEPKCEDGSAPVHVAPEAPVEGEPALELPPVEEDKKAESMEVEFLESNLESLDNTDVVMTLHASTSENPFWNVIVASQPVARIYLQDQQDAETIRASFIQDSYAHNFGRAVSKAGVEKMLTLANAKLFAHKMDESTMGQRIEAKVREQVQAEFADKLTTLRADFLDAVAVAMVASDKNFYGTEANANELKGQIFNNVIAAGVDADTAKDAVINGFEKAPAYFDFIISKAIEIMDMSKDSRETFTKTVSASGTLEIEIPREATAQEEIQASLNTSARAQVKETIRKGFRR